MKNKKFLLIFIFLLLTIGIVGCSVPSNKGDDPQNPITNPTDSSTNPTDPGTNPSNPGTNPTDPGTNPKPGKTSGIEIDKNTIPTDAHAGSVDLSGLILKKYKSDGTYDVIPFSADMLSADEMEKLCTPGEQTIYLSYNGGVYPFDITILEELPRVYGDSVNIFTMNDIHGQLITDDEAGTVGLDKVSTILNALEEDTEYIKVFAGDMFQGTLFSNSLYGLPAIAWFNYANYDCFVLGNHEFDWGIDKIAAYKDGDPSNGELPEDCEILGCNILLKATNAMPDWLDAYSIEECNGYKVGVIGCIGEGLTRSIAAHQCEDYVFVDPVPLVEEYAAYLRTIEKCDVVVVAIHDYNTGTDNDDFAALTGEARIDALICGHTHTQNKEYLTRNDGYRIPVIQCGGNNGSVGTIEIEMKNMAPVSGGKISQYYPKNYGSDTEAYNILFAYYENVKKTGEQVIGNSERGLSKQDVGHMLSDSIMERTNADFGVCNQGGIRSAISSGDILYSDAYKCVPFDNTIYVVTMKGKDIEQALSSSLYLNTDADFSNLERNKEYKIAVISYVYENNGFFNSKCITAEDTCEVAREIMVEYIKTNYPKK